MDLKYKDFSSLFCSVFLIFYLLQSHTCSAIYNITRAQPLSQEETLSSPNHVFEVGFFTPNNNSGNQYVGMWYKQIKPITVVWVANKEKPLRVAGSNSSLTISSNGNLELVDAQQNSVWSTNISVQTNSSFAILTDSGNFIVKDGISEQTLWQSFDHPGNTYLPSTVLGFNLRSKERYVLTSWKNETDPSLGDFIVGIAPQKPPEAFVWNGSTPHWRSGPWDKSKFVGIPEMDGQYLNAFNLDEDVEQGTAYFSFSTYNSSTVSNLFLSSDGGLKFMGKSKDKDWSAKWQVPNSQCDVYGVCGPFGVCKSFEPSICKCLKGFVPNSFKEWSRGNWKGGCLRQSQLFCEKNSTSSASKRGKKDGFWKIGMVKLPDHYEYVKHDSSDGCYTWCLSNCSCLAYAYVNAIGCLVWSEALIDIQGFSTGGQDLFLRLAHRELVGKHIKKKIIISLVASISAGVILAGLVFRLQKKREINQKARGISKQGKHLDVVGMSDSARELFQSEKLQDQFELPIFEFDSILLATNNFSITNRLGQGGFGTVYKGILKDGKEIAVKRLASSSGQGIEEFKNEIVLISKLQHRNLVKVIGFCIEKDEKLLIYEFMPNKSLDTFLFDERRKAELKWARRFNIIHGVARGILYLHRDSCLRVIHRDLKVGNILLDEKMNPKISDFGLARIFQGTLDLANTRRVVGTLGYMSPEYAIGGIFSEKSDVFSFGVLLLEIVSGRKNTSFHNGDQPLSLIAYAWQLWSEGRGLDVIDKAISDSFSTVQVMRCIHVGLLCVQDNPANRPTMSDVVFMLCNYEIDCLKPKQPIFAFQSSLHFDLQSQSHGKCSINDATISVVEGR